jgi:hypothetical protein
VAWRNVAFEPPVNAPYLQETMFRADWRLAELGPWTGLQRARCLYQLDLVFPGGAGPEDALTLADTLRTTLAGLSLSAVGSRLAARVQSVAVGPDIPEPPRGYRVPLTITVDLDI